MKPQAKMAFVFLLAGLMLLLVSALPRVTRAATIIVTNTNDNGPGSLRQAIADAAAGDTITFNLTYPATITLSSPITINKNLIITAPGAGNLTISGNNASRVFNVFQGVNVAMSGLTIANGYTSGGSGGGIDNRGTLTLAGCIISGCRAYFGGAIYNEGTVALTNCTFSNNRAYKGYGGAIHNYGYTPSVLIATNCTFSGNNALVGSSIHNGGKSTVTNSVFSGDNADDRGIINNLGTLTMTNSTLSGNTAPNGGIHNDGTATVNSSTFTGNQATTGAGILNGSISTANVINSTFSGNSAEYGGGIFNDDNGTLNVTGSTFSANQASGETYGGGIDNEGIATVTNTTFVNNSATYGGGFGNWGELTLINGTFSGNSATEGGGIYNSNSGTATLKNTIVADSTAGGNCHGTITAESANNLSTDATCAPGFTQVTLVQLALGTPTGTPAYIPLNAGSAAIDTGTNADCPATDQRGMIRPQDGNGDGNAICDVGSYEYRFIVADHLTYIPLIRR